MPNSAKKKQILTRQFCIGREKHVLIYQCSRCGHEMRVPQVQGGWERVKRLPKKHPLRKPNEFAAKLYESYHGRKGGGCTGMCPKCTAAYHVAREARGAALGRA